MWRRNRSSARRWKRSSRGTRAPRTGARDPPAILARGDLRVAFDAIVERLGVPADVEISDERFPPEIEASANFIVAEALTNIVKHADASRAEVRTSVEHGIPRVEVRDDGIGGAAPRSRGLVGMSDAWPLSGDSSSSRAHPAPARSWARRCPSRALAHVRAAPGPSVETTVALGAERRLGAQIPQRKNAICEHRRTGPTGLTSSDRSTFVPSSRIAIVMTDEGPRADDRAAAPMGAVAHSARQTGQSVVANGSATTWPRAFQ
jgi:hypothetical protein